MNNIFKPPTFDNEEKSHKAFLLHVIVWGLIFVPVPYLIFTLVSEPQDFSRAVIQSMFGEVINFLVLYLSRKGFVHQASIIQSGMLWIFFTITAFSGDGAHSEAYVMGYPLVILIAGILFGGRAASYVTVLSLLAGTGMIYAEVDKLIVVESLNTSMNMWVISLVIFPMIAILQHLSGRSAQNALKRARISEQKYMMLSNISTDYVFETKVDENGNNDLYWVGGAFEKMTGYTFEEYLAAGSWVAHVHPDDLEKDNQDMEALARNEDIKSEIRTITKSGEIRWERIFAHPIWDESKNRLAGVIGAVQDITEVKLAEETLIAALSQSAEMVRTIPDMAWLKDVNSKYIAVNAKFATVAGLQVEDIVGKTDAEIWAEAFAQKYREDDLIVIESQKLRRIEEKQMDHTGRMYWVETIKTPIFNGKGEVIGTTGVARDINERKEAELTEKRRGEMLEKVIELGKHVTESSDLKGTIHKIWHGVHDDLQFDRLAIFLYNSERNQMDDTLGTDKHGQMTDNYGISFPVGADTDGSTFAYLLERPDGFYFTNNYAAENNIPPEHEMHKVRDYAAVAAWAGNKPVAVICADNLISQRPITSEQLEGLRLFAGYAGLAIENTRLNTAIQNELNLQKRAEQREARRRATLEKVIKLGQGVTEVHNLRATLERIWHGVHDGLGFDRLAIFLYNAERNSVDGSLGTNNDGQIVEEWEYSHSLNRESPSSFTVTLESSDGLYFSKNFGVENNIPEGHEMHDVKDFAAVAAWAGEKPVAIISVDNLPSGRPITEEQLEALRLFGGYAGLAIENARLNETIQKELSDEIFLQEREKRRRAILEKVVKLGQSVTEVNDLRTTLTRIWQGVHDGLEFDRTGIYLYNPARTSMDGTFGTNDLGEMVDEWHTWISIAQDGKDAKSFIYLLDNPDSIYITHSYDDEHNAQPGNIMYGVKDFAAVAARVGEKPVAIICVDHKISGLPILDEQLEALRLFAGYAGLAIENARLNTALQNELVQRKTFIEELEAKNAELERFTYTVSHDLKSPLVTIRGFLGYLEQDAVSGSFEKFKQDISRIETAVEKMQNLLRDLLELSRIGRLINPPTYIAFNEIVKDALEIVHGQIEGRSVLVIYKETDVKIHCDRVRLTEVMQNLIENAIKFMGSQSSPCIEIGTYNSEEEQAVFYVKDNGSGIAPEFHEKIFGLFNKLSSDSSGTGIGLALVKRIIEVHGGRIWVESRVDKGATFFFTLP